MCHFGWVRLLNRTTHYVKKHVLAAVMTSAVRKFGGRGAQAARAVQDFGRVSLSRQIINGREPIDDRLARRIDKARVRPSVYRRRERKALRAVVSVSLNHALRSS